MYYCKAVLSPRHGASSVCRWSQRSDMEGSCECIAVADSFWVGRGFNKSSQ